MTDFYRILEVDPEASQEVIAAAYRALAKMNHPDVAGAVATRRMVELNTAYETLRDPAARSRYDATRDVRQLSPAAADIYMSFGRYRGEPIADVPTSYLLWVVENVDREGDIFDASQELIRRGYRS